MSILIRGYQTLRYPSRIKVSLFVLALLVSLTDCTGGTTVHNNIIHHNVTYSQRGTRSEAIHGDLYIYGEKIPDVFYLVIYKDTGYEFYQRYHLWGRDGYLPVKYLLKKEYTLINVPVTEQQIRKGYYRGVQKLSNTPENWLFVRWEGGSAFVDPRSIYELIRDFDLRPIPRIAGIKQRTGRPRF